MLADALKEIRQFVLNENGDAARDEVVLEKLQELERKHDVSRNINLNDYFSYFLTLKKEMIIKGLQQEDGTFPETASMDWIPAEKRIAWYYMNAAQEEENIGVKDALNFCADVLVKTEAGVRAKFYEIRKKVKAGSNPEDEFKKGRGGKVVDLSSKRTEKSKGINKNEEIIGNLETTPTEVASNTEPIISTSDSNNSSETVVETVVNNMPVNTESVTKENADVNLYTKEELLNSSPKITLQDSNIGKSLGGIIKNMHALTEVAKDNPEMIDPIDNIQIANFFIGFEKFLEYGSKYFVNSAETAPRIESLEQEISRLKTELTQERELTESLHKENTKLATTLQIRSDKVEKVFNNIKNAHNTFITKEDFERLGYLPKYEDNMRTHINTLEEIIDSEKEMVEASKETRYQIDTKDSFLRKLS